MTDKIIPFDERRIEQIISEREELQEWDNFFHPLFKIRNEAAIRCIFFKVYENLQDEDVEKRNSYTDVLSIEIETSIGNLKFIRFSVGNREEVGEIVRKSRLLEIEILNLYWQFEKTIEEFYPFNSKKEVRSKIKDDLKILKLLKFYSSKEDKKYINFVFKYLLNIYWDLKEEELTSNQELKNKCYLIMMGSLISIPT